MTMVDVRHGRYVIHIRLRYHRCHCLLNISLSKLVLGVFFPNRFEIEPRPIQRFLQERQASRMRYARALLVVLFIGREYPA